MLLTGGLGGAHLAPTLAEVLGEQNLAVVVNVGDDLDWHGLRVCPDLDTVLYALGGHLDRERGWGRVGDTFTTTDALASLREAVWFSVGDRDLATHLVRSQLLATGRSLTEVTAELAARLGAGEVTVLPASDQPCATRLELRDGDRVDFQQWYVRDRAEPAVSAVLPGRGSAAPSVLAALNAAGAVVIGPSNPLTSIGTILALNGMPEAVAKVPVRLALSPVVVRAAEPSAAVAHHTRARRLLLASLGEVDSPAGVAAYYARRHPGLVTTFLLDYRDQVEAAEVAHHGLRPVPTDLLDPKELAKTLVSLLRDEALSPSA